MPKHRIAVICFLPDTGHVLPLLRLARLLFSHDSYCVMCFLPSKFEDVVREYGFEYYCLRYIDIKSDDRVFYELSKRSIFYNAFSNYYDLSDYYWTPLGDVVSHELEGLVKNLSIYKPQFFLCDSHVFVDFYKRLAWSCGSTLIINRSEGSLRSFQRLFVQTYGFGERRYWVPLLIETAGLIARKVFRFWRALGHSKRRQLTKAMQLDAKRRADLAFKDCITTETDLFYVTAGLAVLEPNFSRLGRKLTIRRELVFPPTIQIAGTDLPSNLEEWLDKQNPGQVVYVCLGTMIALPERFLGELVLGLINAQVSVIWSIHRAQIGLIAKYHLPDNFRIEEFVPQMSILASIKVGCFITHGGAGSAQESVVAGKPVLCIPFMWDQPYNCSVLVGLGVGRTLSKRNLTWIKISKEIRELLDNPVYAETARHLASKIYDLQNATRQSELIREITSR